MATATGILLCDNTRACTRARTESTSRRTTGTRLRRYEDSATESADPLDATFALSALSNEEHLVIPDAIVSGSVASLTTRGQIFEGIIAPVVVEMIHDERYRTRRILDGTSPSGVFAWHPINRSTTPVARMGACTDCVVEDRAMLGDETRAIRERMLGATQLATRLQRCRTVASLKALARTESRSSTHARYIARELDAALSTNENPKTAHTSRIAQWQ